MIKINNKDRSLQLSDPILEISLNRDLGRRIRQIILEHTCDRCNNGK